MKLKFGMAVLCVFVSLAGVFSSADASSLIKFLQAQQDIAVHETDDDIRIIKR